MSLPKDTEDLRQLQGSLRTLNIAARQLAAKGYAVCLTIWEESFPGIQHPVPTLTISVEKDIV